MPSKRPQAPVGMLNPEKLPASRQAWRWVYADGRASEIYEGEGPGEEIERLALTAENPRRIQRFAELGSPAAERQPVGEVVVTSNEQIDKYAAVIYEPASLLDHVAHGVKLYAEPVVQPGLLGLIKALQTIANADADEGALWFQDVALDALDAFYGKAGGGSSR